MTGAPILCVLLNAIQNNADVYQCVEINMYRFMNNFVVIQYFNATMIC
jgi:hypothetical protein